jgi:mannose-1-phosphate guanylyltransferase
VVLAGTEIGAGCVVHDSIVAARVRIGAHCRIGDATIGEGVRIGADNVIARGARLFPGLELPDGAIKF